MSPATFDSWIAHFQREEPTRAKSLLVTILGDSVAPLGGAIWLGPLITLLAAFGIKERLVRTSIHRIVREGWLTSERVGRKSLYRLTPAGTMRILHADRRIYTSPARAWDGQWTLALSGPGPWTPVQRAQLKRDLMWDGYAALAPGVFGHPNGRVEALCEILDQLGLRDRVAVFRARAPSLAGGLSDREIVRHHWPLGVLAKRYETFSARFMPFCDQHDLGLDPRRSFQLTTLMVHSYRRVVLHDPQLPAALLPAHWPGLGAYDLCASVYRSASDQARRFFLETSGLPAPGPQGPDAARFTPSA